LPGERAPRCAVELASREVWRGQRLNDFRQTKVTETTFFSIDASGASGGGAKRRAHGPYITAQDASPREPGDSGETRRAGRWRRTPRGRKAGSLHSAPNEEPVGDAHACIVVTDTQVGTYFSIMAISAGSSGRSSGVPCVGMEASIEPAQPSPQADGFGEQEERMGAAMPVKADSVASSTGIM